jgi:hypothetical protein
LVSTQTVTEINISQCRRILLRHNTTRTTDGISNYISKMNIFFENYTNFENNEPKQTEIFHQRAATRFEHSV